MNGFFRRVTVCNGASPKKGGGYAVEKESGFAIGKQFESTALF